MGKYSMLFYVLGSLYPLSLSDCQIEEKPEENARIFTLVLVILAIVSGVSLTTWTMTTSSDAVLVMSFGIAVATFGAAWGCIGLIVHLLFAFSRGYTTGNFRQVNDISLELKDS